VLWKKRRSGKRDGLNKKNPCLALAPCVVGCGLVCDY
jgi:hypothetical protein